MFLQPGETFSGFKIQSAPKTLCFSNTMSSLKSCYPLVSKGLLRPCIVIKVITRIDVVLLFIIQANKSIVISYTVVPTFSKSFLSARLAHIRRRKYRPKIPQTTENTKGFLRSSSSEILSQSILFGGTKKSLAKDVR